MELINTSPREFTQAPIVRNRTPAPPISQNLVQVNRISSGPSERLSSENQSTMMASTEYFEGTGMSKEDWMRLIRDYREKTK